MCDFELLTFHRFFKRNLFSNWVIFVMIFAILVLPQTAQSQRYRVTNLTSDIPGLAPNLDPNLVFSWGLTRSTAGPWWVNNKATGTSTLYNGAGQRFPLANPLVVTIPPPTGGAPPSRPTGLIFNNTTDFAIAAGRPAVFLFTSEDGTISGWHPAVNPTNSVTKVDNSPNANYTGGAIGRNGNANFLFVANFASGQVEVFDGTFAPVTPASGAFQDNSIPKEFSPFNIRNIGGKLVVTYAKNEREDNDDVNELSSKTVRKMDHGDGDEEDDGGFVDVFDTAGNLLLQIRSEALKSPWGVAMAPADFGFFSNDLLIGNVESGRIAAFDPTNGQFLGFLRNERRGRALRIENLFGLEFGNGATAGPTNTLFFSAAIRDGEHGLFGSITPVN